MVQLRSLVLIPIMVLMPTMLVQAAQAADPVPAVAAFGIGTFLATNAFAVATVIGAMLVWGLSHFWPRFNDISQNADGSPSFIGTWVKRGTAFLATWLVLMALRWAGAEAPAQMVAEVGLFWTQLLEALAGAVTSGVVFKMATTSPKKG